MKRVLAFAFGLALLGAAPLQAQIVCGGPMSCLAVAQTWTAQQTFSVPALFPAGTLGAPGIAFSADADGTGTGWYRAAANTPALASNGLPRYITCPPKALSTTSAQAQTIATITTTTTSAGGVSMFYTVNASNGTLHDTESGIVNVAWDNNAGTVTAAMSGISGVIRREATGTIAATPTVTNATNVVSIKVTPTWVTIVPTSVTAFSTFIVHTTGDAVVCQ